ncbi:MAG: hypothetical protein K6G52_06835 [Treponemataceae bacterium]|nr:hypothetical protein [Treponemataceae bacterium]
MTVIIISSVILFFNIIMWIVVIRLIKKEFSADGSLEEARNEVNKLIMAIDRTAEDDITLIENNREMLQDLLSQIEKKIKLYNNILDQKEFEKNVSEQLVSLEDEPVPEEKKKTANPVKRAANSYAARSKKTGEAKNFSLFTENAGTSDFQKQSELFENAVINDVYGKNESQNSLNITKAKNQITPKKDIKTQIVDMINQGLSSDIISEKLDVPVTQVEMLISVNGKI